VGGNMRGSLYLSKITDQEREKVRNVRANHYFVEWGDPAETEAAGRQVVNITTAYRKRCAGHRAEGGSGDNESVSDS